VPQKYFLKVQINCFLSSSINVINRMLRFVVYDLITQNHFSKCPRITGWLPWKWDGQGYQYG
jgi:hypothetical protein